MNIALCKFSLRKSNGDDSLTNKASWLPTMMGLICRGKLTDRKTAGQNDLLVSNGF